MNYLAHLHLGGDTPAQLLGSLYGDFVKGPLAGQWPADIEAAIRLHRRIDVFTDSHPLQAQARARFALERRRYSGILLDVFFDHCLALNWGDYAAEPLPRFTGRSSSSPPAAAAEVSAPKPPRITLKNERFMPLHIM